MSDNLALNEDQIDCLQELMNISYGSATAAIAKIIDKYATLNIPKIKIVSMPEFKEYMKNKLHNNSVHYVTNQLINGTISGENMFIIDEKSTYNLATEFEEEDIDEECQKDIVLEISNIISSTTLSKLASLIDASIIFSPPTVKIIDSLDNFDNKFYNNFENDYKQIIIISTELEFKEQHIEGELLILSKDESILYLKNSLNKILNEL